MHSRRPGSSHELKFKIRHRILPFGARSQITVGSQEIRRDTMLCLSRKTLTTNSSFAGGNKHAHLLLSRQLRIYIRQDIDISKAAGKAGKPGSVMFMLAVQV